MKINEEKRKKSMKKNVRVGVSSFLENKITKAEISWKQNKHIVRTSSGVHSAAISVNPTISLK